METFKDKIEIFHFDNLEKQNENRPEIAKYYKEIGFLKTIPCFMYFTKNDINSPNRILCSSDDDQITEFFISIHHYLNSESLSFKTFF